LPSVTAQTALFVAVAGFMSSTKSTRASRRARADELSFAPAGQLTSPEFEDAADAFAAFLFG
jgi:hypothetical protein